MERGLRRSGAPMAFSGGFNPHPKISYAGAAPTGVASEAEYFEVSLTDACDPLWVRERLDASLPAGLDVVDTVVARDSSLAERLEASLWEVVLADLDFSVVQDAAELFLAASTVEVERLTKKGRRTFDARTPVVSLGAERCASGINGAHCAILRMVVRQGSPAVRPDDVLTGLRRVADLEPPSPPLVTRLAQGPFGAETGELVDPLAGDRQARPVAGGARRSAPEVGDSGAVAAPPPC